MARRRRLGLLALILVSAACTRAEGEPIPAADAELAAIVDEYRGEHESFGVLFASYDGAGAQVRVAGDVQPGDHLRLGSVSKLFLGFVALREGLRPDATIDAFFGPDRHPGAASITVRQLLNHTSGIPDELVRRSRQEVDPAETLQALRAFLAAPAPPPDERIAAIYNPDEGLDFEPGTRWCYSNTGYMMLGRMLERSTGEAAGRLLERHFATVAPSLHVDEGRDVAFPDSYPSPWPVHWSHPWVAGGVIATAVDALSALRFVAAQPEFAVMQEWVDVPRCEMDIAAGDDYGLALQRYRLGGVGEALGHDGHITARSMLFQLGDAQHLLHVTRYVSNHELREIVERLLRPRG